MERHEARLGGGSPLDACGLSRAYLELVEQEALPRPLPRRTLDVCVVAFSGERDLAEQVASLRSFLRHAAAPRRFVVVSDGSHTRRSRRLLAQVHPCVEVADLADVAPLRVPAAVRRYARRHALGKKLILELALPLEPPTLYADADVLFFAGASAFTRLVRAETPLYLRDCGAYLDPRLLVGPQERLAPANSGVLLLRRPLEWDTALRRLDTLAGGFAFHTEQTLVHLALRATGGVPFDSRRFVVSVADRHEQRDRFAGDDIALRHYTTPVRSKLLRAALRDETRALVRPPSALPQSSLTSLHIGARDLALPGARWQHWLHQ